MKKIRSVRSVIPEEHIKVVRPQRGKCLHREPGPYWLGLVKGGKGTGLQSWWELGLGGS